MQFRRCIVIAIRPGESGRKKLGPDLGVETDRDYEHPRNENDRDEALHEALQTRECG